MCDGANFICKKSICIVFLQYVGVSAVSTRMPMFMSASVYCMRIPVCACAVVPGERGAAHGRFRTERS